MATILTNIFYGVFGAFVLWFMVYRKSKENWFNGHYAYDNMQLRSIEFEVTQVETTYDTKNHRIAKYTITTAFFDDKKQTEFHYNKFVFFDEVGKYNVGDKLILTK